jgi:hypothetical protein
MQINVASIPAEKLRKHDTIRWTDGVVYRVVSVVVGKNITTVEYSWKGQVIRDNVLSYQSNADVSVYMEQDEADARRAS